MDVRQKYGYLIKNIGWMSISNFASKILVFLMVPFYTRLLSTEDYGLYDIAYTAVTLLVPLTTANIAEAVMRFAIVEGEDRQEVFSVGAFVSIASGIIAIVVAIIVYVAHIFDPIISSYLLLTAFMMVCSLAQALMNQFSRGIDELKHMAIGSLVNSVLLVVLSVIFMIPFAMGVIGYFLATSLSMLSAAVYIAISCQVWQYFNRSKITVSAIKKLGSYGMPLGINTVCWWLNSAFGRYVVAIAYGVSGTGLLAAAYKIPAIPKVIQQVFIQAWQISSIKNYDPKDSDGFFSNVYYCALLFSSTLTSAVVFCLPILCSFMFANDFYEAWQYIPILMLGVVFNCIASVIGGIFSAAGDSRRIATSSFVSIVSGCVACILLVPNIGIQGAAISSAVSSVTVWAARLVSCRRYISLHIDWSKNIICFVLICFQCIIALILPVTPAWYFVQAICLCIFSLMLLKALGVFRLKNGDKVE